MYGLFNDFIICINIFLTDNCLHTSFTSISNMRNLRPTLIAKVCLVAFTKLLTILLFSSLFIFRTLINLPRTTTFFVVFNVSVICRYRTNVTITLLFQKIKKLKLIQFLYLNLLSIAFFISKIKVNLTILVLWITCVFFILLEISLQLPNYFHPESICQYQISLMFHISVITWPIFKLMMSCLITVILNYYIGQ